jgi:hypothetical protein
MSAAPSQPTRRLPGPLRFARMAGCSIATPAAAGWVTDFLNAAYHARPEAQRDPADLRLAYGVLTTRWANLPDRRLGAGDVVALHRAYARLRLRGRGRLDRESLLIGASTLIGDWFEDAWADERRRAHGIAFPTSTARDAFTPERRLRHAALGPLTPPTMTPDKQHWATYDSVALPDPEAALRLLGQPARWPDIASAAGRFTALRPGGLLGQTFEIEVIAKPAPRSPVFTRGYVTCTTAHIPTAESGQADLQNAVAELNDRYQAGASASARPILPSDAQPLALVILTTHDGHFLGPALSHLLVWRDARGAWIRDVGAWDHLAPHLAAAYRLAGRAAQQTFWGPTPPPRSMLAQLAAVSSTSGWDDQAPATAPDRSRSDSPQPR